MMSVSHAATGQRRGRAGGPPRWALGPDPRFSQSAEKGLAVLASFVPGQTTRGVAEVADDLGLGRSSTHRFMKTLATLGYLEQTPGRKYTIAPGAGNIGVSALESVPVRAGCREQVRALRDETGLAVSVGVLWEGWVIYLERARGWRPGQREVDLGILGLDAGWLLPAHQTSLGKALLAQLPLGRVNELIQQLKSLRGGPREMTTKAALLRDFERTHREGFALSDRELNESLVSIAAPIRDPEGTVVAALGIEAHTNDLAAWQLATEFATSLTATAVRIAEGYGSRVR